MEHSTQLHKIFQDTQDQQTLFLVRGIAGSGKTTFAKGLKSYFFCRGVRVDHWEADMFFESPNGYDYKREERQLAHNWCYFNARKSLKDGHSVVVANTFVFHHHMEQYMKAAEELLIPVKIYEMAFNFRSIHDVQDSAVQSMRDNWQTLDTPVEQVTFWE